MLQGFDTFNDNYTVTATVSTYILPTQTRFTIAAGPLLVNLTYLTPIELQDWTLHSFPFAYAAFDVISTDGKAHAIQLYTDTFTQFASSADGNIVTWSTKQTAKSIYHTAQLSTPQPLTENNDMSEDGSQYFAYSATSGVSMTWQTCYGEISRGNFTLHGKLDNTSDTNFREIANRWPTLAYSLDLGSISQTSNTLVFGIGLVRDPVLSYRTASATESRSHLWYSRWSDIGSAIDEFLTSYPSASSRANAFDDHIQSTASSIASQIHMSPSATTNLVDLHILNLRQTVGSLEFTVSRPGKPVSMDDVRVFMKDVGYSRRTSPVEILYASFPAFLFLNVTLAGKLLQPLLETQASSLYNNDYAAPDLGSSWPVIQGTPTDQSLAIDSCGAMLIMALVYARKSGDGSFLAMYYDLLRKWADYLVQGLKQPGSYMSSDGLYTSNANLVLKGIMGLYAMGKINGILEAKGADRSKTSYYLDTATAYTRDWLNQAISSDHIMASYGSNSTWAMIYNLFAPRLLGADIIPSQIYELQATWYTSRSGSAATYGLPYDGSQPLAKAHWTLLSASSVFNATSSGGRDSLINMVHSRAFWQSGMNPNPASYSPNDGTVQGGSASPAMGAIYSLLALNLPDLSISVSSATLGGSGSKKKSPVIVGAVFGVLAALLVLVVAFYLLRRRRGKAVAHLDNIDDPLEELRSREQGATLINPATDEIRPLMMYDVPEQNFSRPELRTTVRNEKVLTVLSNNSDNRTPEAVVTPAAAASNVAATSNRNGGDISGEESSLRREMEQLKRAVETLSTQTQQQHVVHQHNFVPDEPPPMYLSPH